MLEVVQLWGVFSMLLYKHVVRMLFLLHSLSLSLSLQVQVLTTVGSEALLS